MRRSPMRCFMRRVSASATCRSVRSTCWTPERPLATTRVLSLEMHADRGEQREDAAAPVHDTGNLRDRDRKSQRQEGQRREGEQGSRELRLLRPVAENVAEHTVALEMGRDVAGQQGV